MDHNPNPLDLNSNGSPFEAAIPKLSKSRWAEGRPEQHLMLICLDANVHLNGDKDDDCGDLISMGSPARVDLEGHQ